MDSLIELPTALFYSIWPSLITLGFAGNLASSAFACVPAFYLNRILYNFDLNLTFRMLMILLFCLKSFHPILINKRYETVPFFMLTSIAMAITIRRLNRLMDEVEAMFVLYAMPTVYAVMGWMFLNWIII